VWLLSDCVELYKAMLSVKNYILLGEIDRELVKEMPNVYQE
jgi:hypothetical protein